MGVLRTSIARIIEVEQICKNRNIHTKILILLKYHLFQYLLSHFQPVIVGSKQDKFSKVLIFLGRFFTFHTSVQSSTCKNFANMNTSRDPPNVPRSAKRSAECSIIFCKFSVPLFNRRIGEGMTEPLFLAFFQFFGHFFN